MIGEREQLITEKETETINCIADSYAALDNTELPPPEEPIVESKNSS